MDFVSFNSATRSDLNLNPSKHRVKLGAAICIALLCCVARSKAVVVTNVAGLSVSMDVSGDYSVQSSVPVWTFGGKIDSLMPIRHVAASAGQDAVGQYRLISFDWTEGAS